MKKKFEKKLELGIEITAYRKEGDNHVFTISFDSYGSISDEYDCIKTLEYHSYYIFDDSWFDCEYCCNPDEDSELGYDIWENGDYHFLKCLFGSESNYQNIIQNMCIDYCKEHNLPDGYMNTINEDEITCFAYDIVDMIEKSEIDTNSPFTVIGKYYENNPFKETKFIATKDSLKLENVFVNMEFERNDNENDFEQFIDICTVEFMNKWNEEIIGKYDWKVIDSVM